MRQSRGYIQLLAGDGAARQGHGGRLRPASLIRMASWLPADLPVRGGELDLSEAPARIRSAAEHVGCLGVVVSLGFDDLERVIRGLEALPALGGATIVLTGATIPPRSQGTDAPGNMGDAIRVACDDSARGMGVLVVAGGRIHAGSEVRYTPTEQGPRLRSEPLGPIGLVTPRGVEMVRGPATGCQVAGGR